MVTTYYLVSTWKEAHASMLCICNACTACPADEILRQHDPSEETTDFPLIFDADSKNRGPEIGKIRFPGKIRFFLIQSSGF